MSLLKQVHSSALTSSDATRLEEKGMLRIEGNGKEYQYVEAETALAKGNCVGLQSSGTTQTNYRVNTDVSDCIPTKVCAGVVLGTVSDEHFGYVQRRGRNSYLTTGGSVTKGANLMWSADMIAKNATAAQQHITLGWVRADDSGSVAAYVHLSVPIMA